MIGDIKKHMQGVPFKPFAIRMTDGREYSVQTHDHIFFPPSGGQVVVEDDDGFIITLSALHMSGLVEVPERKSTMPSGS